MNEYLVTLKCCVFICLAFLPFKTRSQQVVFVKSSNIVESTDSAIISRYLYNICYNPVISETSPLIKHSFKLNFQVPKIKVYNAADYYVDGKFSDLPFNSWGPYQVPFHLNQPIVVPIKEKR